MKKLVCLLLVILSIAMLLASCSPQLPSGEAEYIKIEADKNYSSEYGEGHFQYINDNIIEYRLNDTGTIYHFSTSRIISMKIKEW